MSLSTGAAVKAFLESHTADWRPDGVGIAVYRDRAPQNAPMPYVVVQEGIGNSPVLRGDNGRSTVTRELVQVDYYQPWRKPDGTMYELPQVANKIAQCLSGRRLPTAPNLVYGCHIFGGPSRTPDDDDNIIRNTITLVVDRKLV